MMCIGTLVVRFIACENGGMTLAGREAKRRRLDIGCLDFAVTC